MFVSSEQLFRDALAERARQILSEARTTTKEELRAYARSITERLANA